MGDSNKPADHQDSITPPSWLDVGLIQQAVSNVGKENSRVAKMTVRRAIAPGLNYCSTLYRVTATLSDGKELSFIVKGPAPGAAMAALVKKSGIFRRESIMLADVIPQMEALLEEAVPGRFKPLSPRCYYHGCESSSEFLVMEDLAPGHFTLGDRKRGLGLRHCLFALSNLARFHAASYALLQRKPGLVEQLSNDWRKVNEGMQLFLGTGIQATANAFRTWPGYEEYSERIEKFKLVAVDTFAKLNDPKPGAFNVIVHGDFWVNNMMFRYEDGHPKDLRFIDLQISHVASPAIDILYFLSGSTSEDVHIHHQELLLREYHFALKESLELLGHQAPSLESLLEAIDLHGPNVLFCGLWGIPLRMAAGRVNINAMFTGDSSGFAVLYEQPEAKRWLQRTIPEYARRGWLPA